MIFINLGVGVFPFDLTVLIPDHCLSFYLGEISKNQLNFVRRI